jgi:hypothetical protein
MSNVNIKFHNIVPKLSLSFLASFVLLSGCNSDSTVTPAMTTTQVIPLLEPEYARIALINMLNNNNNDVSQYEMNIINKDGASFNALINLSVIKVENLHNLYTIGDWNCNLTQQKFWKTVVLEDCNFYIHGFFLYDGKNWKTNSLSIAHDSGPKK